MLESEISQNVKQQKQQQVSEKTQIYNKIYNLITNFEKVAKFHVCIIKKQKWGHSAFIPQ